MARPRGFGPASEEPYRRRASDLIRLVGAAVAMVALATQATHLGPTEHAVFDLFRSLPGGLAPLFRGLASLGALWAVGLVGAAALFGRRWRLARDLLVSGLLAWAIARVLGSDVVGHIGLRASLRTLTHAGVTPSFPFVRLSIVMAVVTTAGPYVGRPTRRLGQILVVVLGLSAMYLGSAFPKDVLGGVVLGWGVAAVIHLSLGSPGGRPSGRQLEVTLSRIGIEAVDIRLAAQQGPDATVFDCDGASGPLRVKVIGRDEVDAQLLAKAWRFLVYKEPVPPLHLSRVQQVEHEACMALLAAAAGVRVPEMTFVGRAGPNAAVLVMRALSGRPLAALRPSEVTEVLLVALWQQVAMLHRARIAHGALDAAHVVVADRVPTIVAFARASTAGFDHRQGRDVAELLAATAAIVGDRRAVASAALVLTESALANALPFLQPAALGRRTRAALGSSHREARQRAGELRASVAAAAGVEAPDPQPLQRFRPASVALAVSSLVAIVVLLDQVGDPAHVWAAMENARWGWAAVALALSLATNLGFAVALMGTLPLRLPLWPTTELELAMSYSNLVIPVIGGAGFQIRFLQRQGADLAAAVTGGGLLSTAGTVITQLPLFALAVWLSPNSLDLGRVPVSGIVKLVVVVLVAVGVITAVVFGVPRLRRALLPPLKEAVGIIVSALRTPRQLSLIVGGNLVVSLLYGGCLLCCLLAFTASLSFWTVLAISIGVGGIAALIPVPGGGTAFGSIGLAGALAGVGIPTQVAVTAALANGLFVSYLPALPGWFATRHLLASDYL